LPVCENRVLVKNKKIAVKKYFIAGGSFTVRQSASIIVFKNGLFFFYKRINKKLYRQ
jgi:hypothetical protein